MVTEIRIYIEGGGDSRSAKDDLRRGYGEFLRSLRDLARQRRIRWHIVLCGGRGSAYDDFRTALHSHPDAFNVLLVDAEAPVTGTPWAHLAARDGWSPEGTADDHCHLMVQLMEAWLVADGVALTDYYGQGFNQNPIPQQPDVEAVAKQTVMNALCLATRGTQKGEYRKIKHGAALLAKANPATVRPRARHCERLFTTLTQKISEA